MLTLSLSISLSLSLFLLRSFLIPKQWEEKLSNKCTLQTRYERP